MQKRQKSTLIQEEKKKNNNNKANTKTSQSKMWNVKKDFLTFQAISLVNWWKALL